MQARVLDVLRNLVRKEGYIDFDVPMMWLILVPNRSPHYDLTFYFVVCPPRQQ